LSKGQLFRKQRKTNRIRGKIGTTMCSVEGGTGTCDTKNRLEQLRLEEVVSEERTKPREEISKNIGLELAKLGRLNMRGWVMYSN